MIKTELLCSEYLWRVKNKQVKMYYLLLLK